MFAETINCMSIGHRILLFCIKNNFTSSSSGICLKKGFYLYHEMKCFELNKHEKKEETMIVLFIQICFNM